MSFLSRDVQDYRIGLLDGLMEQEELDAVVVFGAEFFQFFSNFHLDVLTWERPVTLVLPRGGAPFALMNSLSTNHLRMARERQSMWVEDVTIYFEHPKPGVPLVGGFVELLAERLAACGLTGKRIGTDIATPALAAAAARLDGASISNVQAGLRRLRWIKHAEELAIMREIADLSDWVQDRYREQIRPGRLVQEMDLCIAAMMVEEAARRYPGENLEVLRCYTLSGPDSASPHGNGAQTGARVEAGHGLVNIVIPRLNGVTIENERVWFCGRPDATQTRHFETARVAQEAAIEAMVAGRPVSGIDKAAREVFERDGCGDFILHRTGHGMGLIGHEFPEDMPFNNRALLADEVYSAEPGIYVYGVGGFRFDDTVVIGERPEILTRAPRDLRSQTVV
ncbi:Xaa-Pro peptidase family protein [Acidiphilium sp. JA12-A1]|uniref:M24 family metallopeptidase n=1 Tax=Acidiphilium sp. JA12-A1 TaxID=1464546 RepID=UPI0004613C6E|nr:Xaa-Pro peptidase family protein [Acidiphilium sp. JA12-A1]KDM65374.1 putative dipeptidase PepE [Acidiphilium sp. JA12-A1]